MLVFVHRGTIDGCMIPIVFILFQASPHLFHKCSVQLTADYLAVGPAVLCYAREAQKNAARSPSALALAYLHSYHMRPEPCDRVPKLPKAGLQFLLRSFFVVAHLPPIATKLATTFVFYTLLTSLFRNRDLQFPCICFSSRLLSADRS